MGLRFACARAVSAASTWGLKHVFRRPAANFPGKIALYVDPAVIGHARGRLTEGSVAVVGTNGKTTVTNLLADALEAAGQTVVCNRTGANLDSGVATALLHARRADWGVFECDELWLAKILPHLQATYVVLLNLFRDQLDRVGEIDRIQDAIVRALESSPATVLIYNADDPLCMAIADRAGNAKLAFGVGEDMRLAQNTVADAQMCQRCSTMLDYRFRQYGQLGDYVCPACGFGRAFLDYAADQVRFGEDGLAFWATGPTAGAAAGKTSAVKPERADGEGERGKRANNGCSPVEITAPFDGAYMVYNLMAVFAAADALGVPSVALQQAINTFDPRNGRLQRFDIGGRAVLLNLAKNPTGFNQNIKIILGHEGPKIIAFFVNDKEGDGRDVSWLWDIDFEDLAEEEGLLAFAGGIRRNDVQVRLKYAGIDVELVDDAADLFARLGNVPNNVRAFLVANYTALPPVHAELGKLAEASEATESSGEVSRSACASKTCNPLGRSAPDALVSENVAPAQRESAPTEIIGQRKTSKGISGREAFAAEAPLVIAHLFPDLLNLYGDGGNVAVLAQRCRWRGIPVEVRRVEHGQTVDLTDVDLAFLGGGPDREQRLASEELMRMRDDLRAFVEDDGVLLAICGGFQILGHEWLLGDEIVEGLGIVDVVTKRPGAGAKRLIGNSALTSPLAARPVVGYENHAGRTHLGAGVEAFGDVVSTTGHGNNDDDKRDGVRYRNVIGTYLHGPLLPKNPEIADDLLARALARRNRRCGIVPAGAVDQSAACLPATLAPLNDAVEIAANDYLCRRMNVG